MNSSDAMLRLEDLCPPDDEPTLSSQQMNRLLAFAAVEDEEGRDPTDPDWIATFDQVGVYRAAREGWIRKKARAASRFDFTTDGQMFKRSQLADHCDEMIRRMNVKLSSSQQVR
jgi:hypothetical protein